LNARASPEKERQREADNPLSEDRNHAKAHHAHVQDQIRQDRAFPRGQNRGEKIRASAPTPQRSQREEGRMNLSPNFHREEFERDGPMPDEALASYTALCGTLLEPIRERFGPILITSGYRSASANRMAGGVPDSQHVATADHCAADWWIAKVTIRDVFDWIRLESSLVWDQLILEHGDTGDIIHLSWSKTPRREALEGLTGNRSGYERCAVKMLPYPGAVGV